MKKQAAKKTADAATTEAPKLPKTAKRLKAKKAIKDNAPEAPETAAQVTKETVAEVATTPAPKPQKAASKKESPQLLPEAERMDLRRVNMLEYNAIRKAVREGAKGDELEKLVERRKVLDRIYREQNLKQFSNRK
jgi:hypothetical protein